MTESSRGDFAREISALARLAPPLIAAQLAVFGQSVIEVALAGHFSPRVLAAVAIGANLASLPLMAMIGIMFAVPPSVAHLAGAGRRDEIAPLFRQSLFLALGVGVAMLAAVRWGMPRLVHLAGIDPALTADVGAFLGAVSWGMPAIGLFSCCRGLSDGLSRAGPTMALSVGGLFLLAPLGYLLMYGAPGVPSLGAAGTGYAASLVNWIDALAYYGYLRWSRHYRSLGWSRGPSGPVISQIAALLRVGLPMGVSTVMEVGLFSFAALLIGRFGIVPAAAHQIAINVAGLTFMVPLGLASAITVRVGTTRGSGDPAAPRRAGFIGLGVALALQSLPFVAMLSVPDVVAGLYTDDPAVIAGAATLLRIAAVFQFSDGLQVACMGALRGMKDTRVPMLIAMFAYWGVGLPVGLFLGFDRGMGAPGVWIGLTAGLTMAAGLLLTRFSRLSRA